jgi:hypothetical protein
VSKSARNLAGMVNRPLSSRTWTNSPRNIAVEFPHVRASMTHSAGKMFHAAPLPPTSSHIIHQPWGFYQHFTWTLRFLEGILRLHRTYFLLADQSAKPPGRPDGPANSRRRSKNDPRSTCSTSSYLESRMSSSVLSRKILSPSSTVDDPPILIPTLFRTHSLP